MGFDEVQDTPYGEDERWLEVRSPDKGVILILGLRREGGPPRRTMLPTSNVFFYAEDLDRTSRNCADAASGSRSPRSTSRSAAGRCSRTPKATASPWSPGRVGTHLVARPT